VKVWDAQTGQPTLTLQGASQGAEGGVAFSPDGRHLAWASGDKTVKVCDTQTGQETLILNGHSGPINRVAYSPDGRRLASASSRVFYGRHGKWTPSEVKVWDAQTGQDVLTLKEHTNVVWSVAFSPDGRRLACGSVDQTVKVWDAQTGEVALCLRGHTGAVVSVAFSPDGRHLASASDDRTVKVWNAEREQEALTLKGPPVGQSNVAFSPDGRRLASAYYGVWDSKQAKWTPNGVKVCDTQTGQEILILKGHSGPVNGVAYSPDGRHLASASGAVSDSKQAKVIPGQVKVWDAQTGQETLTLQGAAQEGRVAFSPDGRRLACASQDGTVKVWDAQTGQEALSLKGHTQFFQGVAFSPDGRRLACVTGGVYYTRGQPGARNNVWLLQPGEVRLWDAQTGQEVLCLKGHSSWITCVAFSPDGRRLASASTDRTVKVWDAQTGQELLSLKGHTDTVLCLAYNRDSRRLATASVDNTVKVWDAQAGQEILTLKGHTGPVRGVAFSSDGRLLASASQDGTVKVWDATPARDSPRPQLAPAKP
jgi:WD40 repeat protein